MYEVMRPFGGPDGRTLERGEMVDASEWRNLRALVNMGRLRLAVEPKKAAVKGSKTVKVDDTETL